MRRHPAISTESLAIKGSIMDAIQDARGSDPASIHTAQGIALAAQGRLSEAENRFRRVVQLRPEDAAAHNHLGAVLAALQRWDEAIASYRRAIQLRPALAAAHGNLADALRQQGHYTEALDAYQHALRRGGDWAETHFGLANTYRLLGRHAEAAACYRRTLDLRPGTVEAQWGLAAVLAAAGRPNEAHEAACQALRHLGRASAGTCFELGTTFLRSGRFEDAMTCYHQALRLRPDDPDALNNLGTALWELSRLEEAEAHYRRALALRQGDAEILNNLGNALREQARLEEAAACYREALRLREDSPETLSNLGVVLTSLGTLDEAEASLRRAIALRPDWALAHDNLATVLWKQGKLDAAIAGYEAALRLAPGYAEAHRNRAMVWLQRGDFARGWPEYEWRTQCRGRPAVRFPQPRWHGEELAGRTILLHGEQGLGDTLQFVRYAPLVQRRGGIVRLVCPRPLVALLARSPGIDQVIAAGAPLPPFDVHAPLMSLPLILGATTEADIRAEVPYLFAGTEAIERRRHDLERLPGIRVGIAWQGNPRQRSDRQRSFPLAALAPLARVKGVHLISLQRGAGTEQRLALGGRFPVTVLDGWEQDLVGDLLDTAAILSHLDLVVTPCSALAHLAGGLGVRAWVALASMADWRWLSDRDDSPWYPSLTLFRQRRAGEWNEVFERMAEALERPWRS
jgi:tetratricopeptide (TPR) repeat protein